MTNQSGQPEQRIEPLAGDDAIEVEKKRTWVREHFVPEAQHRYDNLEDKLRLIQTILNSDWVAPDETWKLQSLGIGFGDALLQEMDLIWVLVEDENGRNPALMVPKTTILVFPQTAISKRVEDGEKVDIPELFRGFCKQVSAMKPQYRVQD